MVLNCLVIFAAWGTVHSVGNNLPGVFENAPLVALANLLQCNIAVTGLPGE